VRNYAVNVGVFIKVGILHMISISCIYRASSNSIPLLVGALSI